MQTWSLAGRLAGDRLAGQPGRRNGGTAGCRADFRRTGATQPVSGTEFRLELQARGLPYVLAVKASTSAYPADAEPVTPPHTGRGRPPAPRYPAPAPPWPRWRSPRADRHYDGSPGATPATAPPGTRPRR
jgi:hypothetical protein